MEENKQIYSALEEWIEEYTNPQGTEASAQIDSTSDEQPNEQFQVFEPPDDHNTYDNIDDIMPSINIDDTLSNLLNTSDEPDDFNFDGIEPSMLMHVPDLSEYMEMSEDRQVPTDSEIGDFSANQFFGQAEGANNNDCLNEGFGADPVTFLFNIQMQNLIEKTIDDNVRHTKSPKVFVPEM